MKRIIILIISLICVITYSNANIDLLINLIDFYKTNGQYEKALEQIEKGLELAPDNARLASLKDEVLKKIQEEKKNSVKEPEQEKKKEITSEKIEIKEIIPEKKLRPFKFFSDAEKEKIKKLLDEAIDLKSLGRSSEAKARFEEVLKYDELNEQANFYLGVINVDEGDFEKAKERFNNVLTYNQENTQVLYWLGLVYMRQNDRNKAKAFFLETIKKQPNSVLGYVQLASIYESENNVSMAETYYRKAIQADKRLVNIYKSLSNLYISKSMYSKASDVFREMITAFPKNVYGYSGLSISLMLSGDFENGAVYFQNAARIDENNPEVKALSSMYSLYSGKTAEAEEKIGQALEKEPDNIKIYRLIISVLKNSANSENVRKYCEMGLRYFPLDPVMNLELAKYFIGRTENEKALPYLEKASQIDNGNPETLYLLAQTYNKAGYYIDSIKKYRQLVKEFPQNKEKEKWIEEGKAVMEVYRKEKQIEVETPQSNFDDNAVYDFNIPQGF